MNLLRLVLAAGLVLLAPMLVAAQALDPTFAPPASLYSPGAAYSMSGPQADGKRVFAGYFTRVNGTAVGSLVRLDAAGALDAAFAQNVGVARNTFRVKTLPSGQYLVSGFYNDQVTAGGLTRTGLLRLNANGLADATFNAGTGAATTGSNGLQINTFVGLTSGKVLVAGIFNSFGGQNTAGLVRLNADGSPDAAFNANLGTGFTGPVNTVAVQADGKILVGGIFTALNGQTAGPLLRLNADGTRDTSFSTTISPGSYVGTLLVQPDGKVLVTGIINLSSAMATASLVRLLPSGAADSGFTAPASTANYAGSYFDTNVLLQPDGKIILGGSFAVGSSNYLVRLTTTGAYDTTFSPGNTLSNYPYTIGLQPDGSVLVGGSFTAFAGRETGLGRLSSTGVADAAYAPALQVTGSVTTVVRQPDGQLVLGGDFTEYNGVAVHRVVRLAASGALDAAFVAATAPLYDRVQTLALQADGKILVSTGRGLRRLLATGGPDTGYGTYAANADVEALAVQPDGKVLAAGYFPDPAGLGATQYLVRLTTAGTLDATFSAGSTNAPGATFYLTALALQPDGKVLAGGSFLVPSGVPALRIVRYESTGAVDATFSSALPFAVGPNTNGAIVRFNALAVQADGKVLVGGYFATADGAARTNLARLSTTGQLDAAFVPPATLTGAILALAVQPNGRILLGSGYGNDGSSTTTPLVRVLSTGATDPSFGPTATPDGPVTALLVQPNGAIVVGGSFSTVGGAASPGLARITAPNVLAVAAPAFVAAPTAAWPVPAHTLLHVAPDASARPQQLSLLDALGRVVRSLPLTTPAAEYALPVEGLTPGVYLLRVQYAAGAVTRPLAIE